MAHAIEGSKKTMAIPEHLKKAIYWSIGWVVFCVLHTALMIYVAIAGANRFY